jgi:hypothetical protein
MFSVVSFSQFTYKIKADSTRLYNDSCNAELIIENATRNVNGFLYNKGNGRTEFKKPMVKLNDSTYLFGGDTLKLNSILYAFSNGLTNTEGNIKLGGSLIENTDIFTGDNYFKLGDESSNYLYYKKNEFSITGYDGTNYHDFNLASYGMDATAGGVGQQGRFELFQNTSKLKNTYGSSLALFQNYTSTSVGESYITSAANTGISTQNAIQLRSESGSSYLRLQSNDDAPNGSRYQKILMDKTGMHLSTFNGPSFKDYGIKILNTSGNLMFDAYPYSRNDGSATKFLTTDSLGNVQLKSMDFSGNIGNYINNGTNTTLSANTAIAANQKNFSLDNSSEIYLRSNNIGNTQISYLDIFPDEIAFSISEGGRTSFGEYIPDHFELSSTDGATLSRITGSKDSIILNTPLLTIPLLTQTSAINDSMVVWNPSTKRLGYKSVLTASATTINNNSDNRLITGSNTSNVLEGENNATFSNGHLSITQSTDAAALSVTAMSVYNSNAINAYVPTNGKAFVVQSAEESAARSVWYGDGAFGIGPGNATRDIFLSRSSANTFKISSDRETGAGNLVVTSLATGITAPTTTGTTKMVITDANGLLSTEAIPSATPAGANGEFQYNNNGSFGATSGITYNSESSKLNIINTSSNWSFFAENTDIDAHGIAGFYGPLSTSVANGKALGVGVSGEDFARSFFYTDGSFGIGAGSTTRDAFLSRPAANTFKISSDRGTGAGNLIVTSLASGGSAPTTSGTTKMVIADENGLLSTQVIPTAGSLSLAGTADGQIQFKSGSSLGASTGLVWDDGTKSLNLVGSSFMQAPTGTTNTLVLQANSTQNGTGGTTDGVLVVKNLAGTQVAHIREDGFVAGKVIGSEDNSTIALTDYSNSSCTPGADLKSSAMVVWSSGTNWWDTKDLGMARNTAGVLEVNNGTAGTLRDLKVRSITGAVKSRVNTVSSNTMLTPIAASDDVYTVTALGTNATFSSPGTGTDAQQLVIRIKDNGTARTLSWNTIYRASADLPLPTATVLSKTMYLKFMYNEVDSKWDFVAYLNNF